MKTLKLGFSPCPNDTYIFDAMVHGKVDTEGLHFEVTMDDVEALNKAAFEGDPDITKLSYHAYAYLREKYILLNSGSALGNNCGPLLIANASLSNSEINKGRIAIPGKYTTANLLLSLAFPEAKNKYPVLFSEIENDVLAGLADAGLIIHENRFTYASRGLKKLIDLGEFWEEKYKLPIPLGGIVAKRSLKDDVLKKIDRVMRRSVQYAMQNPGDTMDYVKPHAQEMEQSVLMQHIGLYVNRYTEDLGSKGKEAIRKLFEVAEELNIIPSTDDKVLFIEP